LEGRKTAEKATAKLQSEALRVTYQSNPIWHKNPTSRRAPSRWKRKLKSRPWFGDRDCCQPFEATNYLAQWPCLGRKWKRERYHRPLSSCSIRSQRVRLNHTSRDGEERDVLFKISTSALQRLFYCGVVATARTNTEFLTWTFRVGGQYCRGRDLTTRGPDLISRGPHRISRGPHRISRGPWSTHAVRYSIHENYHQHSMAEKNT